MSILSKILNQKYPTSVIKKRLLRKQAGGDAWEPGGGEKFDIPVSLNFFRIPILRKAPKYLMVLPVRARLATARARLGFCHFPNF